MEELPPALPALFAAEVKATPSIGAATERIACGILSVLAADHGHSAINCRCSRGDRSSKSSEQTNMSDDGPDHTPEKRI